MHSFRSRGLLVGLLALAPAVVCGCSDDNDASSSEQGDEHDADAATTCSAPPFLASETGGLTVADSTGGIHARIVSSSTPQPAYGYNDWTIALTDASGAPLSGAKVAWACSWMPAHGHGANPTEIDDLGNGRFDIKQQNLAMFGQWFVRYWITTDPSAAAYLPQQSTSVLGGNVCTPSDTKLGAANIEFTVCVLRDQQ